MKGKFWENSRKVGSSGFYSELGEKVKKEGPQQVAQHRDKLKKGKGEEKKASGDKLPGGKADHDPDSKFSKKELSKGKEHEKEHTKDPSIAKEIAKDHIKEDKEYYDKLDKMEKKD